MVERPTNTIRGATIVALLTAALMPSMVNAQSQSFIIDDSDQRVEFEWISNSMQQLGVAEEALLIAGTVFDEQLVGGAMDPDYTVGVVAEQASIIESSSFSAMGSTSFTFEAGEFAQGAHADIESRSFFYLYFEPEATGLLTLNGTLDLDGTDASVTILIESFDGTISLPLSGSQPVGIQLPIELGQFISIQITARVSFLVDDPFAFETTWQGAASFSIDGVLTDVPPFRRADCNADGSVNVADAVTALDQLFIGATTIDCPLACDANDDDAFDISDPVFTLAHLFTSGPPPPDPFVICGPDPTPTALACEDFVGCP